MMTTIVYYIMIIKYITVFFSKKKINKLIIGLILFSKEGKKTRSGSLPLMIFYFVND